ncbi:MAG: hypothetical protein AAGI34_08025 [Pseudomonadota bacterium]
MRPLSLVPGLSACVLLLSGCVLSPERIAFDRVRADDAAGFGVYSIGGGLTVAAGLRNVEGQLAVCGAFAEDSFPTRRFADVALGAGSVRAGGQTLAQNLTFMTPVRGAPLDGASTGCAGTGQPWNPAFADQGAVEVVLPRIIVERECDGADPPETSGGCNTVRFRQIGGGDLRVSDL